MKREVFNMKRCFCTLFFLNFVFQFAHAQAYKGQIEFSKIPTPSQHYQEEYTFDTTLNTEAWKMQKKGLHVSFATTDELFFRSEVPDLKNEDFVWNAKGWRGERLNVQVLIWSVDTINQIRFAITDLKNSRGKIISKLAIKTHLVRYVVSNYPYGAKDATCGVSEYKNLYLVPDRFEEFDRFDLPGKSVRPVWLSLDIPSTTEPGTYNGTIEVKTENHSVNLSVKIVVQKMLKKENRLLNS